MASAVLVCGSLTAIAFVMAAVPPPHSTRARAPLTHPTLMTPPAALAAELDVIAEGAQIPEYRRDDFGIRWADTDGNGCDQRQDVLTRDLTAVVTDGCTVLFGELQDPYTGLVVEFQHDRVAQQGNAGSQGVQIDHVISLSAAHQGGAWQWTLGEREQFANDLENLLAVDGPTNQSKSDRGPAQWLPPDPSYRCDYATRYVTIATTWDLAVTVDDRAALINTLNNCPAI